MNELDEYIGKECYYYYEDENEIKKCVLCKVIRFEVDFWKGELEVLACLQPIEKHELNKDDLEDLEERGASLECIRFDI